MKKFDPKFLSDCYSPAQAYNLMESKSSTSELEARQTILAIKKLKTCGNHSLCKAIKEADKNE